MSNIKQKLIDRFGEHRVSDLPVKESDIPLLILDVETKTSPVTVIVTNGLSNYKMPVPKSEAGLEYTELFFCLPSYWTWQDLDNPNSNWIFNWIQRLTKYVIEKESWFGHGHTMPAGSDMKPLSDTMKQNHFILINPLLLQEEMSPLEFEDKDVHFLAIVPIFADEMDYKQGKGTLKFLRRLINKGVSEKLDDYRYTTLKSKWRLRRKA